MAEHEPPLEVRDLLHLHDFIRGHHARIQEQWERAVRLLPSLQGLPNPRLVSHLPVLLERVAERVEGFHQGARREEAETPELHGLERLDLGFDLEEVSNEYSALRTSILRLYGEHVERTYPGELSVALWEVERFNQAFDELMVAAIARHARSRERTFQALGVALMGSRSAFEFSGEDVLLFHSMMGRATALIVQAQLAARERQAKEEAEGALTLLREQESRTAASSRMTCAIRSTPSCCRPTRCCVRTTWASAI